jgi:hypothetical protein
MALMFPRLARNFVKNGYFPTDEPTLERALNALMPSDGPMCILDPCAGEGVAIAEAAHALGREQAKAFAVEFDAERTPCPRPGRSLLHADLMDTMISKQRSGCWLNPPYGDLSKDVNGNIGYQGQGRARSKSCSISARRCCSTAACWSSSSPATCSTRSWSAG